MHMIKHILLYTALFSILAFASIENVSAQYISQPKDKLLTEMFKASVKSIDEFEARFNGTESHPDIPDGEGSRRRNIYALFNIDSLTVDTADIMAFTDSVLTSGTLFNLQDKSVYALAETEVKYKGKNKSIRLILLQEKPKGRYSRWAIGGVSGLVSCGIIPSTRLYDLSPVDHEVNFMGIGTLLKNNPAHAYGYRNADSQIDQLSVFLTLVNNELIQIGSVTQLHFYCIAVPGWIFELSRYRRNSHNSGWLISNIYRSSEEEKIKFLNTIFREQT